jgi:itaconyl-CoA hydratase
MTSRTWYARRRLLGIDSIAMTHPVFGGDTLYAASSVTSLDPGTDPDVGQVSISIEGSNQRGQVVSKITCKTEVYRRGRHPEDKPEEEIVAEERFNPYHKAQDGALVEQTGLDFEDLVPGETFVHWPGRTFDFSESRLHALRSLEINPRWSDEAYIRKHAAIEPAIFEPLVIGALTALTTRTMGRVVANLGWSGIELPRPVRPGETIYAESTICKVRGSHSRPTQGIAEVESCAFVESGELVCRYQRALLVYRRGAGPYAAAGY